MYALFLFPAALSTAQGTFQNLDFELANVTGAPGSSISTLDGIPGWTAYYGTAQAFQITYDTIALGSANISILDQGAPYFPPSTIIQGAYSVVLQSGMVPPFMPGPAAIAQTGTVPATSLSLQFLAQGATTALRVSFNDHNLSLVPLSSSPAEPSMVPIFPRTLA